MAQMMRSPEGEEHDIPDAGVAALARLGWEQVEQSRAQKAPAKKAAEKPPAKK